MTSTAAASAATTSAAKTPSSSLTSLAGNFQDFLKLLMTQLQNQDPTSPMDTNQFTSQLVQFASVEQQINTNTSLTSLIQATQGNEILQSASLIGKQVTVASDHLPLQSGKAALRFESSTAQQVKVEIYSDAGAKLREITIGSRAGSNDWAWDGLDAQGNKLPDGSYRAVVTGSSGGSLPFTVSGTVTGMHRDGNKVGVSLGLQQADLTAVQSVSGG